MKFASHAPAAAAALRSRRAGSSRQAPSPRPRAQLEQVTVIHAGTLLAIPGQAPRRKASIIVRGSRIAEVRDGFAEVPGARVVDLRDSLCFPA